MLVCVHLQAAAVPVEPAEAERAEPTSTTIIELSVTTTTAATSVMPTATIAPGCTLAMVVCAGEAVPVMEWLLSGMGLVSLFVFVLRVKVCNDQTSPDMAKFPISIKVGSFYP